MNIDTVSSFVPHVHLTQWLCKSRKKSANIRFWKQYHHFQYINACFLQYLKEHYTKLLSKSTSVINDGLPERSRSTTVSISQKRLNASAIQVKLDVFFPNSGQSFRLTTVAESNLAINKAIFILTFLCTNIYLKVYRTKIERILCNITGIYTTVNQIFRPVQFSVWNLANYYYPL